jgi:peptidoglycan/xylan/chitin deacetylase (PgdA/CDA1 family)
MYHAFGSPPDGTDPLNLSVTPNALRLQLDELARRKWEVVTLGRYADSAGWANRRRAVLFTIDDGYRSVADVALPIFARFGIRPTVFVVPALVGTPGVHDAVPGGELLDASTLRTMASEGIDIGAHGWDHREMAGMTDAELDLQTRGAREAVADICGVPPRAFAYPVGTFDDRARRAVERAGFDVAFSVHHDAGQFAVSRIDVNATDTVRSLRVKLLPNYRGLWRTIDRLPLVRPAIRRLATR